MDIVTFIIQFTIVIGVLFLGYILLIRPQIIRSCEHKEFMSALRVGDRVALSGGLIGIICDISNDEIVEIELSNLMRVHVLRRAVDSKI
jgi:preprotein translocase subunit YajC